MAMVFTHPGNGHSVIARPFLWCLLFGSFYFLWIGNFKHAIVSAILAICTFGICWLIYPFFAPGIVREQYLERGFRQTR